MSNGNHFYLLYLVYSCFILAATAQIYKKQKSCLKPEIILVISKLLESAVTTCSLGIYLLLVRAWDFDKSSWALRVLECIFVIVTFFKCLDNILQQLNCSLEMTRIEKDCEVRRKIILISNIDNL